MPLHPLSCIRSNASQDDVHSSLISQRTCRIGRPHRGSAQKLSSSRKAIPLVKMEAGMEESDTEEGEAPERNTNAEDHEVMLLEPLTCEPSFAVLPWTAP